MIIKRGDIMKSIRVFCLLFSIVLTTSIFTGCGAAKTTVPVDENQTEPSGIDITAQVGSEIEWSKSLGGSRIDFIRSIQQTNDGGYIAVGDSNSNDGDVAKNNGNSDVWVLKIDGKGEISWIKSMGGSLNDYAYSIQQTNEGGYIMAGYSYSNNGDVSGNHGGCDAWVVKLNSSGSISWRKCLGGSGDDYAYSIQQTSEGGYIVAGSSFSNSGVVTGNHGGGDAWIVKLNDSGSISWNKSLGGSGDDYAKGIQQTSDGGYIVSNTSYSNSGDVTGNHGKYDVWIVKLNDSGVISWSKCLGGSGSDYANGIQKTSDGGYFIVGYSDSLDGDVSGNHGLHDGWIVKLNDSGSISWSKSLGGSGDDYANGIQKTSEGGYIIAGNSSSNDGDVAGSHGLDDGWVVKLDSSGAISWTKCLGGNDNDIAFCIQQTSDGGYIAAGNSYSNNGDITGNHGDSDGYIIKLK
jgi:hypothetical protein